MRGQPAPFPEGRLNRILSIASCVLALAACAPHLEGSCQSDGDCRSGESCSADGLCLHPADGGVAAPTGPTGMPSTAQPATVHGRLRRSAATWAVSRSRLRRGSTSRNGGPLDQLSSSDVRGGANVKADTLSL